MKNHQPEKWQPRPQPPDQPEENQLLVDLRAAETQWLHRRATRIGTWVLVTAGALLLSHGVAIKIAYSNGVDHGRVIGHEEYLEGDIKSVRDEEKRALARVECTFMADARQENPGLYAEAILTPCTTTPVAEAATSTTKQGG